jgi:hypothetical protein
MPSRFNDQSNFLVAFVASIIGLLVFRTDLEMVSVSIFAIQISIFSIVLIFIGLMGLSSYVSALAIVSKNINFTLFPLPRYLEKIATYLTVMSLLYPMFVVIIYTISLLASFVSPNALDAASLISTMSAVLAGFYLSYVIGRGRQQKEIEDSYLYSGTLESRFYDRSDQKNEYSFLEHYQFVTGYAREYLRTLGYGVRASSLSFIFSKLSEKNQISEGDLSIAQEIANTRNQYAHGIKSLSKNDLATLEKKLDYLYKIINKKFATIVEEGEINI